MQSNIQQYYPSFYILFMKAIFPGQIPSHPGRGHGSLTGYMTQFERFDFNIMIEYVVQVWEE